MHILWAANHPQFARYATREFLRDHTVVIAPSLVAARAALAKETFAVVMIDFDLDGGKGDVLMRELRSTPGRPWLIATSSHDTGNDTLVEAGADVVCGKLEFGRIRDVLKGLGPTPG